MTAAVESRAGRADERLLAKGATYVSVTRAVSEPLLERRFGRAWRLAFAAATLSTVALLAGVIWLFVEGIGIWGVNTTVVWGYAIASYVWWIGIGNAGTLISSMLLLTRQRWRASINRFAEAMTLFAASIAGLLPILHLGRPYLFYWLAPYPNTMGVYPQWRSALVWDFWAILSYLLFSIMFWYVGLIPDLATLRDHARSRLARLLYGAFALGWRGSARHWHRFEAYYWAMASLGVPLVCSVHSVVGLDFAASLMPGWSETIFPPYFVVGAMYSGFGIVVMLSVLFRWGLGLHDLITMRHLDLMGRILLMCAIVMGYSYATEWFTAWYAGSPFDRGVTGYQFTGTYAPLYWTLLLLNVAIPQALWFRTVRRSIPALFAISLLLNVGMWLERILIIWMTLTHGHLPSRWTYFYPTAWDWLFLFAPLGFFAFMFLCLVRLVPVVSMHEVRKLVHEEGGA